MGQFRDLILRTPIQIQPQNTVASTLTTIILDQIQMDRNGEIIDRALVKSCIYMLEGLYESDDEEDCGKLYLTMFEPEYLNASRTFYGAEGAAMLIDADAGAFCRHAQARATEEQDRCRSTLSPLTAPKIRRVVEEELIRKHLREVIDLRNSGVRFMLDNDRYDDLRMVYDLSTRVEPEKGELRRAVQGRIVELGTEINAHTRSAISLPVAGEGTTDNLRSDELKESGQTKTISKPAAQQTMAAIAWVEETLHLKAKFDKILREAFEDDQSLQTAVTRSFSDFINDFHRSPEFLSLFFDENMKKGIKGKTEHEVDVLIDHGICLLGYIQDKDMFERYYKKHLSRRLLMKRSVSMDAERQMISKMKMAVGNAFTTRIEKMFQDMSTSADLTTSYKAYVSCLGDPDPSRADLEVSVLTSTIWPLETMTSRLLDDECRASCIFPIELERLKRGFEKFYLEKHSGRQLTWQAHLGTAELRACFPESKGSRKTRELIVQTYGMIILLLFNHLPANASLTCEEIQARTNIPLSELKRHLQSLSVAPKTRILRKEPMSKDVDLTDKFSFNAGYQSNFQKIKVLLISSGNHVEGTQERDDTERKNDNERQGVIDAALVRIMKCVSCFLSSRNASLINSRQRKELLHQTLIAEVIQQLHARFSPDISMVKRRIESLIDREYLERIEQEQSAYRYLA